MRKNFKSHNSEQTNAFGLLVKASEAALTPQPYKSTLKPTMPAGFNEAFRPVKELAADFRPKRDAGTFLAIITTRLKDLNHVIPLNSETKSHHEKETSKI